MLDDIDRRLLRQLQADPNLTAAELGERAGVSALKATRRLGRLQEQGILKGQHAVIDWAALGFAVGVSLRITLEKTAPRAFDDFIEAARGIAEVTEIQTFLGRVDVRLSVIARDMAHYQQIYRDQILALPHMADIEALMTVATLHNDESLPL
ncbi:Lrp/AsnC family transcriptional regulator [Octadecabacter sp.]|jgi:Lrp/AsnC family transcriptional regulator|nr:Lrp/AsnC family transcriptional regulator [Octadecabacter sp.]MDC1231303.1 Lrp/AsnC family transcriptional regulator [Octadecabacter sp.]MDC1297421.1 Lrp/AsnC family transcriptional regulator [Octadecabacter sp.]MDC1398701.1 Lrp/AsnC family transcriptional regulator [Octadecabacter sp.]MDC1499971.1 Lrp/AsnC family transcriptional regulator [Octadecabacter sp.]|tara:strand:- start:1131 stop:1586 length:456 start_codon:yes stop_codon:yes gene_type:complete